MERIIDNYDISNQIVRQIMYKFIQKIFLSNSSAIFSKEQLDVRLGTTVIMIILVGLLSLVLEKQADVQFTPEVELKGKVTSYTQFSKTKTYFNYLLPKH